MTDPVAAARGLAALLGSIHRDARREARSLPRPEEHAAAARAFWDAMRACSRRGGRARRTRTGGGARAGARAAQPVVAAQPLLEPRLREAARVRRGLPDARVDLRPRALRMRGPDAARGGQRPRSPVRRPAQRALRLAAPCVVRAAGERSRRAFVAAGPRPRHRLRREPLPARRDRWPARRHLPGSGPRRAGLRGPVAAHGRDGAAAVRTRADAARPARAWRASSTS